MYHNIHDEWTLPDRPSVGNRDDAFGMRYSSGGWQVHGRGSVLHDHKSGDLNLKPSVDGDRFADKGYAVVQFGKYDYDVTRHAFGQPLWPLSMKMALSWQSVQPQ